jgi:hypothetical protein
MTMNETTNVDLKIKVAKALMMIKNSGKSKVAKSKINHRMKNELGFEDDDVQTMRAYIQGDINCIHRVNQDILNLLQTDQDLSIDELVSSYLDKTAESKTLSQVFGSDEIMCQNCMIPQVNLINLNELINLLFRLSREEHEELLNHIKMKYGKSLKTD